MRQTLFYLPHEIGPLPLFGWVSWSMLGLLLYLGITLFYSYKQPKGGSALYEGLFNWIVGAAVLGFVLPAIEAKVAPGTADQIVVGLPVRGYGLMMMLGVLTAVGISYRRVLQLGVAQESFLGLVLWTVVGGLLGARLFYIVQKWSELDGSSIPEKLWTALQFTEGGLVVYGAILGGIAGILGWTLLQKVVPLSLLDAIVPAFFIGLAFGRIGCLMNGGLHGPTRFGQAFGNSYQVDPWTRLDDRCGRSGKLGSASWHHAGPNPRFDPGWTGAASPPGASPSHARARPTGARRSSPHRPSSDRGKGTTQSKFAGSPIANLCFDHGVFALFLELDDPPMGPASRAGLRLRLARLRGTSFSRRDCSGRRRGTVRYRSEYRPMGQHRRVPLRRDPDGILMVRIVEVPARPDSRQDRSLGNRSSRNSSRFSF